MRHWAVEFSRILWLFKPLVLLLRVFIINTLGNDDYESIAFLMFSLYVLVQIHFMLKEFQVSWVFDKWKRNNGQKFEGKTKVGWTIAIKA